MSALATPADSRLARIQLANDFADATAPGNNVTVMELYFAINFILAPVGIMIGLDGIYIRKTEGIGVAPGGAGPAAVVPYPTTDTSDTNAYVPLRQVITMNDIPFNFCGRLEVNGYKTKDPVQNVGQLLSLMAAVKSPSDLMMFLINVFGVPTQGVMDYTSRPGMTADHFVSVAGTAAWYYAGMQADTWKGGPPPIANGVPVAPGTTPAPVVNGSIAAPPLNA